MKTAWAVPADQPHGPTLDGRRGADIDSPGPCHTSGTDVTLSGTVPSGRRRSNSAARGSVMSKSNRENNLKLNRRQALFLPATAGLGAALALPAAASDSTKTAAHQAPGLCTTPRTAVAKTQYGKVRGYVDSGAITFKGIPYGQNTRRRESLACRPKLPSRGTASTLPWSTAPTARSGCMTSPASNKRSFRIGTTAT